MPRLPRSASWLLSNNLTSSPPFAALSVDFGSMTGSVKLQRNVQQLPRVHRLDGDGFWSAYDIDGKAGRFEATIDERGVLSVAFTVGAVKDTFTARPVEIEWGGRRDASARVRSLDYSDRLKEAIERALPLLPPNLRNQVAGLLSPQSLSIMAGTTAAWLVSHFFGVGEIADLILIVAGGAFLGLAAADIASDLNEFARRTFGAESEEDLDVAGQRFASAVAKGGVNLVSTILLRKFAEEGPLFRDRYSTTAPYSPRTGRPLGSTPGRWFYRPRELSQARPPASTRGLRGNTSLEGDVWVNRDPAEFQTGQPVALERLKTFRHESAHSFLTPRLQVLRELRIQLRSGAYERSHIMRYLEEALAEAYGRWGTVGDVPRAIRFPVDKGYVTVAKMGEEARGILQGSINVGGVLYQVFLTNGRDDGPIEVEYEEGVVTLGR